MAESSATTPSAAHAIIAGYGVPGRAVGEWCKKQAIPFVVVELNEQIVERVSQSGVHVIQGSISEETTLREAGVERAVLLAITVPDDKAALAATTIAREANSSIRIITRCAYISVGMEASKRGADQVVIAEQVVAESFLSVLNEPKA